MAREYYLISKRMGEPFTKYKNNALRISVGCPYTVDEIVVGIRGKTGLERKITTFRDSNGKIIERAFNYFDKPYRNRIYSNADNIIGEEQFVTSTTIKEYKLKRAILNVYKDFKDKFASLGLHTALWKNTKTITNHLCENINTGEKVLSQTRIENIKYPSKQLHSFIEFPHIIDGKRQDNNKKLLQYMVNTKNNKIYSDFQKSEGLKNPRKIFRDMFLPFRALSMDEIIIPLTKFFIKQRGLSRMELIINTNFMPQYPREERLTAFFLSSNGSINFNKQNIAKSKSNLVSTIRHEVEHGWQYYLDARNIENPESEWQTKIFKKFGEIKNPELKAEAEKYTESIDNYIQYYEDYEKYKKNYIEVMAEKAGNQARGKYNRKGQELRNSFPYIPRELL